MPWQTMDPGSSTIATRFPLLSIGPIVEHSNEERVIKTLGPLTDFVTESVGIQIS